MSPIRMAKRAIYRHGKDYASFPSNPKTKRWLDQSEKHLYGSGESSEVGSTVDLAVDNENYQSHSTDCHTVK